MSQTNPYIPGLRATVGHGLPGRPTRRGMTLDGSGHWVVGDAQPPRMVRVGEQVLRADFPELSAKLPPNSLSQAWGCRVIPLRYAANSGFPCRLSKSGRFLLAHNNLFQIDAEALTSVKSFVTDANQAAGNGDISDDGELFSFRRNGQNNSFEVWTLVGNAYVALPNIAGANFSQITCVSIAPNGLDLVIGGALSTTSYALQLYRRATANSTAWSVTQLGIGSSSTSDNVRGARLDPVDGSYLIAAIATKGLQLYKRNGGNFDLVHGIAKTFTSICSIEWSANRRYVSVSTGGAVQVYELVADALVLKRDIVKAFGGSYLSTWHGNDLLLYSQAVASSGYGAEVVCIDMRNPDAPALSLDADSRYLLGLSSVGGARIACSHEDSLKVRGSEDYLIANLLQPNTYIG